jgi:hypothetical protein
MKHLTVAYLHLSRRLLFFDSFVPDVLLLLLPSRPSVFVRACQKGKDKNRRWKNAQTP